MRQTLTSPDTAFRFYPGSAAIWRTNASGRRDRPDPPSCGPPVDTTVVLQQSSAIEVRSVYRSDHPTYHIQSIWYVLYNERVYGTIVTDYHTLAHTPGLATNTTINITSLAAQTEPPAHAPAPSHQKPTPNGAARPPSNTNQQ